MKSMAKVLGGLQIDFSAWRVAANGFVVTPAAMVAPSAVQVRSLPGVSRRALR
jgi:hypothetical protein